MQGCKRSSDGVGRKIRTVYGLCKRLGIFEELLRCAFESSEVTLVIVELGIGGFYTE